MGKAARTQAAGAPATRTKATSQSMTQRRGFGVQFGAAAARAACVRAVARRGRTLRVDDELRALVVAHREAKVVCRPRVEIRDRHRDVRGVDGPRRGPLLRGARCNRECGVRAARTSGYSLYSMTAPAGAATAMVAEVSLQLFHSGFGSAVIVARSRHNEERLEMSFGAERLQPIARYARATSTRQTQIDRRVATRSTVRSRCRHRRRDDLAKQPAQESACGGTLCRGS